MNLPWNMENIIHDDILSDDYVKILPDEADIRRIKIIVTHKLGLSTGPNENDSISSLLSNILNRSVAIVALLLFSPLLIVIYLLIKFTSNGPALFTQSRVGRHGKVFKIYKFRTMIQDAEQISGPVLSWQGDPRITSLGNFLRRTHLDELGQLINIVKGEMNFIGPRPERPEIIDTFESDLDGYHHRESVLPGITGLAQVCSPYDASPKTKLKYDLFYILNQNSITFNALIIFYTIRKILTGKLLVAKQTISIGG